MSKRGVDNRSVDAVAKIMAMPVQRPRIWVDKLTPDVRKVIVGLKKNWRDGNFPPCYSMTELHRHTCKVLDIKIGRKVFSDYFQADD